MRYRLTTTRQDGEQRTIDYTTRNSAFSHFSSMAHSRHTIAATLFKNDADPDDFAPDAWRVIATMAISRDAAPAPEVPR